MVTKTNIYVFTMYTFVTPSQNLYVQRFVVFGAKNSRKKVDIAHKKVSKVYMVKT